MKLCKLSTPSALVDSLRMQRNIGRMQQRMDALGVAFRPHVKTAKRIPVAKAQVAAGASGISVSTLKEAEQFFAIGIAPHRLRRAADLLASGCKLKILADSAECAAAIVDFVHAGDTAFEVWIEIDSDGHRSGVRPESDELLAIGKLLHAGGATLGGVMTYAGASYELNRPDALAAMAELERSLCVLAAQRLRVAGLPCPNVSVGSTLTALSASHLEGVTEVRAGVYVFFDLVMANIGVCQLDDLALSVLTTVIGHQREKGWAIVDAGWMAMSRDRGTQKQTRGYGQVCNVSGEVLARYVMSNANQEHGIVSAVGVARRRHCPALSRRHATARAAQSCLCNRCAIPAVPRR